MSDKKDNAKDELMKEFDSVKNEIETKKDIIHEIDEVKEDISTIKDDLIEEIRADDIKDEKRNRSLIIIICIIAVAIIGAIYFNKTNSDGGDNKSFLNFSFFDKSMPKEQAVNNAFEFIKKYLAPGMELTLGDIEKEKFTFYKFNVKAGEQNVPTYISTDGKIMVFQETDITKDPYAGTEAPTEEKVDGKNVLPSEGGFKEVEGTEVCKENGKPIVYFFGSESCPHCKWQQPVIESAIKGFGNKISFHKNIDSTDDMDIFTKYNPSGGVPTIVIGCKYYRIGSGEGSGEDADKQTITNLINNVLK